MDLYCLAAPLLRLLDPETSHSLAIAALRRGLVPSPAPFKDKVLESILWGMDFPNPVGLAAGFDKDASVPDAMLDQGFGFVEVGTVTPRPQPGNPRPRLFRLTGDGAVINRMGFNNGGGEAMLARMAGRNRAHGIIGVNLGKNKTSDNAIHDYITGARLLSGVADYMVINVSSPNTPGLRDLQSAKNLAALLSAVQGALPEKNAPPLLLKIAPDLGDGDLGEIAKVALDAGLDGIIATNTTIDRPTGLSGPHAAETGGLSGRPLLEPSTKILSDLYRVTKGRIPLIGVGGISSGADAYAKIRAGASLVQLYTALVYHGPGLVNKIKRDLAALIRADGFQSVNEAVGADHR